MLLPLDNELLNYKLYQDFLKLYGGFTKEGESLLLSLSKLPIDKSFEVPAVQKLMECLDLLGEYDKPTTNYILADFLASKGTYRVKEIIEKYLHIEFTEPDGFEYSPEQLKLKSHFKVTYKGTNLDLLLTLISDLLNFELYFTSLDMLIKELRHILDVENNTTARVLLDKFTRIEANITWTE